MAAARGTGAARPTGCRRRGTPGRSRASEVTTTGCGGEVLALLAVAPDRDAVLELGALGGGDVEHRLLDVELGEHVGDHLGRHLAGGADLQHPAPLRVDHRQPDPGVELARRLLVGGRAEPLPGGEVALLHALLDQADDVVRVVVLEALELFVPGLRGLLEQGGPGQRVVHRVGAGHPHPAREHRQREPLDQQGAGDHGERGEQQHLPVLGVRGDDEGGRQRDDAAHAGPAEQEGVGPGRVVAGERVGAGLHQQVARREDPDQAQHDHGDQGEAADRDDPRGRTGRSRRRR